MPRDRRPLAAKVQEAILEMLEDDGLDAGARVPSELELAQRFEVARTTVREALRGLEQQGVIDVQRGLGRFVSASAALGVQRPITEFESVTEMMQGLGYALSTRVLTAREQRPSADERETLGLGEDDLVTRLERLRSTTDRLLVYSINILPSRLLPLPPDAIDWSGSVVALLDEIGHKVTSSVAQVRAATLPATVARVAQVEASEPWLLIEETCVSESGTAVLLARDFHRGDLFAFRFIRRRTRPSTARR